MYALSWHGVLGEQCLHAPGVTQLPGYLCDVEHFGLHPSLEVGSPLGPSSLQAIGHKTPLTALSAHPAAIISFALEPCFLTILHVLQYYCLLSHNQ